MALCSDAVMALYYDIAGDTADHDDWHTYEHLHERLSIPGFVRATRWIAGTGQPRYMVIYEVAGIGVATSDAYLARLNDPTPWTASMMPRFRGMIRGFASVAASAGCGLGNVAVSVRFTPASGRERALAERLAAEILPALATRRGMAGACLLRPAPPPPMTREQAMRGPDAALPWVLLASAYDADALDGTAAEHLTPQRLGSYGASAQSSIGRYSLHVTMSAQEVARTAPNPPLRPGGRRDAGARR